MMTFLGKLNTKSKRECGSTYSIYFITIIAVLGVVSVALPAHAIFNCLTPNMFRGTKNGQYMPPAYGYPMPAYQYSGGSSQSPFKKSLFQPKWRGGEGSIFGNKNYMSPWRNLYRPGYGYGYGYGSGSGFMAPLGGSGYAPVNEQLNVAPFSLPSVHNSYSQQAMRPSDGWSSPLISTFTTAPNQYDAYQAISAPFISSTNRPSLPLTTTGLVDPYGIKGGGSGRLTSTTKNNVLLADGGYDYFDAHLVQTSALKGLKNHSFGYSYPSWHSSYNSVDSPARIAQQLFKNGIKRQRLEMFNNRSAQLVAQSVVLDQKFTILDEPRFVGFGKVQVNGEKEARLSCSFGEAIDESNVSVRDAEQDYITKYWPTDLCELLHHQRPLWVKFTGPYNSSQVVDGQVHPPFNCDADQCRTQEIETKKNFRYKFDNGPATSTLIISDSRISDYGIYRCSALTKTINNNPLATIYQVVKFGDTV